MAAVAAWIEIRDRPSPGDSCCRKTPAGSRRFVLYSVVKEQSRSRLESRTALAIELSFADCWIFIYCS